MNLPLGDSIPRIYDPHNAVIREKKRYGAGRDLTGGVAVDLGTETEDISC